MIELKEQKPDLYEGRRLKNLKPLPNLIYDYFTEPNHALYGFAVLDQFKEIVEPRSIYTSIVRREDRVKSASYGDIRNSSLKAEAYFSNKQPYQILLSIEHEDKSESVCSLTKKLVYLSDSDIDFSIRTFTNLIDKTIKKGGPTGI